jgi:hypothetical protein
LRCGPTGARDTIVHGKPVVRHGQLVSTKVEEMMKSHTKLAAEMQQLNS